MKVLVIDIGGNSVKILVTGETEARKFPSGPTLTPRQMVSAVLKLTDDWKYYVVSIGFPGRVRDNQPISELVNLGHGWIRFDFAKAFRIPVKVKRRRRAVGPGTTPWPSAADISCGKETVAGNVTCVQRSRHAR
jgi:predicted NBD/HSP70 family sugar kinase